MNQCAGMMKANVAQKQAGSSELGLKANANCAHIDCPRGTQPCLE